MNNDHREAIHREHSSSFFSSFVFFGFLLRRRTFFFWGGPSSLCQLFPRVMVAISSSSMCWICISKLCCGCRFWCQMRNEFGFTRDAFKDSTTQISRMPTLQHKRYMDQEKRHDPAREKKHLVILIL